MTKEEHLNALIAEGCDTNQISDGYHTFGELYEHRITLFIALCRQMPHGSAWKSLNHSDGSNFEGWFILGIDNEPGKQITYHLPISKWDECAFFQTLNNAPAFDGHTSEDVLNRISRLS
jgi:hypothetical protein